MAVRPTTLALENLESRLNLSTVIGGRYFAVPGFSPFVQERTTVKAVTPLSVKGVKKAMALPAMATQVTATKYTFNSIRLTWKDNATNESGYHVLRSTDGVHYSQIATLPAGAKSYLDKNLKYGTTYYYKVAAVDPAGQVLSGAVHSST